MSTTSVNGIGSTTGITFGGLASGLDTQAIIGALLAVEQRPISLLEQRRQDFVNRKNLFGDLEQHLDSLLTAADGLRRSTGFLEFSTAVADETILSATASSSAKAGTYTVNVSSLAKAEVSATTTPYTSGSSPEITGSASSKLTIQVGSESPFDVDLTNELNSLDDIATAINSEEQGVTAEVVKIAEDNYSLVLTGEVGSDKAFTVTGSGTAAVVSLANELNTNEEVEADDAVFTVNGIELTRTSNQVADAITGVTLDLLKEGGGDTTLTVSADTEATADKVQDFVEKYNAVVGFVEAQRALDPETNSPNSPLFGDSTVRTIGSSLRSILGRSASTGNEAYELLSQVGITADTTGTLSFERSVFDEAVKTDDAAVTELFTESATGFAQLIHSQVDDYLDTVDGILVARLEGFDSRIRDTDNQIRQAEERLARTEVQLTERFANLEVLLSQLQSQGAALGGLPSPNG